MTLVRLVVVLMLYGEYAFLIRGLCINARACSTLAPNARMKTRKREKMDEQTTGNELDALFLLLLLLLLRMFVDQNTVRKKRETFIRTFHQEAKRSS